MHDMWDSKFTSLKDNSRGLQRTSMSKASEHMLETFKFIVKPCSNWGAAPEVDPGLKNSTEQSMPVNLQFWIKLQPVGCELFVTQLFSDV